MAYPERGADYKHRPKFLDRAIAAEGRADGGAASDNMDGPYGLQTMDKTFDRMTVDDTKDPTNDKIFAEPGPSTGDRMDADTSPSKPAFMRGLTPKRDGGRVRRADGGRTDMKRGDWATTTSSNSQTDVDAMTEAGKNRQVAPMSQQQFKDGSRGPLNITPNNIPLDSSRNHGGRARNRAVGGPINADGGGARKSGVSEGSGFDTHYDDQTNSAGPQRITEEMGTPPFVGRKMDTQMDTDTDFGQANEIKTLADRMAPVKNQDETVGSRADRRGGNKSNNFDNKTRS